MWPSMRSASLQTTATQFNRIMATKGYSTLIADLKSKEASLAASMGT
jgi:hypothetical protein